MNRCTQKIVDAGVYTIDKETKIGTYELSNGSSGSEEVSAESESVSASQVKATLEKKLAALARRVTRLEAQLEGRGGAARVSTWARPLGGLITLNREDISGPDCPAHSRARRRGRKPTLTARRTMGTSTMKT